MEYITVKDVGGASFVEKKSRFIGSCAPVSTEQEALSFIAGIKAENREATHNVSAYILRSGLERFSDDGEPQGKAGIPVLDAMKKSGVTDAVIVATRYFGGIMLGGGGLIRAYSHTASIAIEAAGKVLLRECPVLKISCGYSVYGKIAALLPECGAVTDETEFLENTRVQFHIDPLNLSQFEKKLADLTNGKVSARLIKNEFFPFDIKQPLV